MKPVIFSLIALFVLSGCVATVPPAAPLAQQATPQGPDPLPAPRVSVQEQVYFDPDSTIIAPESWKTLETVAQVVRMNKELHVHLVGRTEQKQNVSLALRRAIAVRNALSQLGLSPDRISVQDESQSDTLLSRQAAEKTRDAKKSRRVDIIIETITGDDV